VDESFIQAAQRQEALPALPVRLLAPGTDLSLDDATEFVKQVLVEGLTGQDTVLQLKQKLADKEGLAIDDQRIFLPPHELRDETKLGECFVQWAGFGLDNWPPRFIVKRALKGFEMSLEVPAMRETALWDLSKQKLKRYGKRRLTFDLMPTTTVGELKQLIEHRLGIAAAQHVLSAQMTGPSSGYNLNGFKDVGYFLELDDNNAKMEDYGIHRSCLGIHFRINRFDDNGDFIFEESSSEQL